jgi:hypothetical protein
LRVISSVFALFLFWWDNAWMDSAISGMMRDMVCNLSRRIYRGRRVLLVGLSSRDLS